MPFSSLSWLDATFSRSSALATVAYNRGSLGAFSVTMTWGMWEGEGVQLYPGLHYRVENSQ
jgi:hypothetical protein